MMGRGHALLGTSSYMVLDALVLHNDPIIMGINAVTIAGWSVLPDLDEPNSTIAITFGPVSNAVSRVTRRLAGGHRMATHSLMFAALGSGLGWCAGYVPILAGVLYSLAFILAARLLLPDRAKSSQFSVLLIALGLGWLVALGNLESWYLTYLVPLGVIFHILGDFVTNTGVAILYPFTKRKFNVSMLYSWINRLLRKIPAPQFLKRLYWDWFTGPLFTTGSVFELYILTPVLFLITAVMLLAFVLLPSLQWIGDGNLDQVLQGYSSYYVPNLVRR